MNKLTAIHPGEILLEDYLKPLKMSQYKLAQDIGVPAIRISQIVNGKRSITADTALRLARYFNTSPEIWLRIQARFDVEIAQEKLGNRLINEVKILQVV